MKVLVSISVLLLSVCGLFFIDFLPYQVNDSIKPSTVKNNLFYVSSHGMHTGLIIEAKILNRYVDLKHYFPDAKYYEIGWGDAKYYQKKVPTSWDAAKALLIPSSSVLHIVGFNQTPVHYFTHVKSYKTDEKGVENLSLFFKKSFALKGKKPVDLGKGLYGNSRFFQAKGVYFFANTCNKWTAKGLNSAGIASPVHFTLFASDVF